MTPHCLLALGLFTGIAPQPEANLVDVHVHLNGIKRVRPKIVWDFPAAGDELVKMMDRLGIAKAIVMPPPASFDREAVYQYDALLPVIRSHPNRLFLAAGGDALNPMIVNTRADAVTAEIRSTFSSQAEQMIKDGAKAFGEMMVLHFSFSDKHPFEQVAGDHPLYLLLADIAAKHGVPIDLHMEAVPADQALPKKLVGRSANNPAQIGATLPGLERLLAHNRQAKIVWQHIGWDNTGHMTIALLRDLLKKHSNLFLALKAVQPEREAFRVSDNDVLDAQRQLRPGWLELFQEFPDRFVVGSDEFVHRAGQARMAGPPSLAETWRILDRLPPQLRASIGSANAGRIYGL